MRRLGEFKVVNVSIMSNSNTQETASQPEGKNNQLPDDVQSGATTAIQFNQEEQLFHKHLTLGIEEKLHRNRMIKEIKLIIRQPADKLSLSAWERKAGVPLPSDLRDYYMSTNGFKLTWSLEHAGDILKIGEMSINSIVHLISLESPSPNDPLVDKGSSSRPSTSSKASMDTRKSSIVGTTPKTGAKDSGGIATKYASLKISGSTSATANKNTNKDSKSQGNTESTQEFPMYYQDLRQTMEANGQVKSQDFGGLVLLPNDKAFILDSNQYGWVCLIYPHASNTNSTNTVNSKTPQHSSASVGVSSLTPNESAEDLKLQSKSLRSASSSPSKISFPGKDGSALQPPSFPLHAPPPEPSVEIWFLDQSFQWHYLSPTFTHYYRMMLFHLGLPQWQYRFTPFGLSSWAEQMFWLVAPHLLTPPKISKFPSMYHAGGLWSTEVPTEAAAPNPTLNVLTNQIFKRKKKDKEQKTSS